VSRPELTDYLDADGGIVLPDGVNLVTFLDRHIADIGDAIAYRYLDYTQQADGKVIDLTWAELGARVQAIGARLQQVTSRGRSGGDTGSAGHRLHHRFFRRDQGR
jgi:hypothetical protein